MFRGGLAAALLPLLFVGCGGSSLKTHEVTGTVSKAGVGLEGVMVTLSPASDGVSLPGVPSGVTDASGKFSLTLPTGQVGAPPGEYKVLLRNPPPKLDTSSERPWEKLQSGYQNRTPAKGRKSSQPPPQPPDEGPIPADYSDPAKTPVSCKVPDENNLTIEIP